MFFPTCDVALRAANFHFLTNFQNIFYLLSTHNILGKMVLENLQKQSEV